ncbi:MAG: prepilin-type N-terminal cleavage/methylation domain-containing protein [Luteolibacter sp.]|uniref:prepilin-type N-terminal cleavage/methylation domain-containing protein n=1 Tax=Luteolibacter sp. TaxID=1962973 RepID=UPI003263F677
MISAVRTNKPLRGFTLIELVMVMAIAGVVMAGAVGLMVFSSDERALRNASGEIELMAKRARTISILHQTPYALEFRDGRVNLLPFAQAGRDEKKLSRSRGVVDEPEPSGAASENRWFKLQDGMELSIRHWNSDKWLATAKNNVQVWRFDPDGLCEPISVRLTLNKSWAMDTFHPLTASISDSELEAR